MKTQKPTAIEETQTLQERPTRRASFQVSFNPTRISFVDRYYKRQFDALKWEFVRRCAAHTPIQTAFVLMLPQRDPSSRQSS